MSAATVEATTFAALGEPTRLRIVELLRRGPLSVGEIVEQLDLRQPQVSKHLRVLGASGIVAVEPQHRHRIYRLRPEPFHAVEGWVGSFEQLWEARLDSLGAFLHALHTEKPSPTPKGMTDDDQADR